MTATAILPVCLRTGVLGLLAATAVLSAPGLGPAPAQARQPQSVADPRINPPQRGFQAAQPQGPIISIDFPGGTVKQFVQAIQKASSQPVNVMVSSEAESVPVPPVVLKQVTVDSALSALILAARPSASESTALDMAAVGGISTEGNTSGVFTLSIRRTGAAFMGQPPPSVPTVEVYSLRDLIEAAPGAAKTDMPVVSVDTVLTAIDAALGLGSSTEEPPQIKFHKDSGMLIVRGTQLQNRTVHDVLQTLRRDIRERWEVGRSIADRATQRVRWASERERVLAKASIEVSLREQELAAATKAFERAAKRFESGEVAQDETAKLELEVAKKRAGLEMAILDQRRAAAEEEAEASAADLQGPAEQVLVIYDLRDLKPFFSDITETIKGVTAGPDPSWQRISVKPISGDSTGSLEVRATPAQHRTIIQILNTARRLKANEPRLPGLDPDEVLKKSGKE